MAQFLVFFLCAILGCIFGRRAANKSVMRWAVKSGIEQDKAETLYFLLQNGNKLERQAKKEAKKLIKDSLIQDQLEKTKKEVTKL